MNSGDKKGFCVELVDEIAKLLGKKVSYEFMGWSDAQAKVRNTNDALIFPLVRTAEREPNYGWLLTMFDLKAGFVTKPGSPAINRFDDGKSLASVGVVAGSLWGNELAKQGITNIKPMTNNSSLVAALVSGEIAAAYGPDFEIKYVWRTAGHSGSPVFGEPLQKLEMYIATSKEAPSISQADWRSAFEALQQDGTFDRIYESYFGAR